MRDRRDRGSTVPLILGFAAVLLVLVAVVVDATAAFTERQRLETLAAGAALQGADQGAQGTRVYGAGPAGSRLSVTQAAAQRAVTAYLTGLGERVTRQSVRVDARGAVDVEVCERTDLPLGVPGLVRSATVCGSGQAAVARDH